MLPHPDTQRTFVKSKLFGRIFSAGSSTFHFSLYKSIYYLSLYFDDAKFFHTSWKMCSTFYYSCLKARYGWTYLYIFYFLAIFRKCVMQYLMMRYQEETSLSCHPTRRHCNWEENGAGYRHLDGTFEPDMVRFQMFFISFSWWGLDIRVLPTEHDTKCFIFCPMPTFWW